MMLLGVIVRFRIRDPLVAASVEDVEYVLAAGDAMYFEASVPHSYRRKGRQTCSALVFAVPQ